MCGVFTFGAVPSEAQQGYGSDRNIPFRDRESETTVRMAEDDFQNWKRIRNGVDAIPLLCETNIM